jgi:hypothetical protein
MAVDLANKIEGIIIDKFGKNNSDPEQITIKKKKIMDLVNQEIASSLKTNKTSASGITVSTA